MRARCESRGIQLRLCETPDVLVAMPPDELRQVLTNLISNASDAFSPLEANAAASSPLDRRRLIDVDVSREAESAIILVRDTGAGIEAQHMERIFDPFFTTKDETGTGIGLWVTRELVEKNGGMIGVESGSLDGAYRTCFRVVLPLAKISASAGAAPE
jgi:signal transduction histidine kinase